METLAGAPEAEPTSTRTPSHLVSWSNWREERSSGQPPPVANVTATSGWSCAGGKLSLAGAACMIEGLDSAISSVRARREKPERSTRVPRGQARGSTASAMSMGFCASGYCCGRIGRSCAVSREWLLCPAPTNHFGRSSISSEMNAFKVSMPKIRESLVIRVRQKYTVANETGSATGEGSLERGASVARSARGHDLH